MDGPVGQEEIYTNTIGDTKYVLRLKYDKPIRAYGADMHEVLHDAAEKQLAMFQGPDSADLSITVNGSISTLTLTGVQYIELRTLLAKDQTTRQRMY